MRASRKSARSALAVLAAMLLAGCDGGTGPGGSDAPVAMSAPFTDLNAVPGSMRSLSVRVVDAAGRGVRDVQVTFTVASGNGDLESGSSVVVTTNGSGLASTPWFLPYVDGSFTVEARAAHGGAALSGSPITFSADVESFAPTVDEVLVAIEQHIDFSLAGSEDSLMGNPLLAAYISAKIGLLRTPNLASAIVAERLFETTTASSIDARELDVVSVFPRDTMRTGAQEGAALLVAALPVLETFLDAPLAASSIRVWYGFSLGSSGGGGSVFMEDRGSYQARTPLIASPLPHDAIFVHELAHSFFGHESLTQFLELLVYNVLAVGSTDVALWTHRRGYTGPSPANTGVQALLEIRELIGHDAMARAYRAILPLRPWYGELLTAEMKQKLVDEAPPELRAQVAEKAEQIGY